MRHWIDILSDNFLFEMAYQRRRLIDLLASQQHEITQHLIKLAIFPQSRDRSHWRAEIRGFIDKFSDIGVKPRYRKLSQADYYEYLFAAPVHDDSVVERKMRGILRGYPNEITKVVSRREMYDQLSDFYLTLGELISTDRQDEIFDLVDDFCA